MMKCFVVLFPILFLGFELQAQLPEDALRMSYLRPGGTAREQAIGGAMGSLGGDISANFVNPAGLGFYKTSDFVLSPAWSFTQGKSGYLSNNSTLPSVNHFILGTSGIVYGWNTDDPQKTSAISLAVTQNADFNRRVVYQGSNNYSSGAEAYAEEFNHSGYSLDQALSAPDLSYGTRMALYTYLIDTSNGGSGPLVVQPLKTLAAGGDLLQRTDIQTSGGITEVALGVASATRDKWYLGFSIGIPIVNYHQTLQYTESDPGNKTNDFANYTYTENYSSTGVGVNVKLGAIFRPNLNWRIGLAVHTPSFYSLTDKITAGMVSNTENYHGIDSIHSDVLDNASGASNQLKYDLSTPWHMILSGTYIFPGSVTEGKMGFITGDVEYVAYRGARFSLPSDETGNYDDSYYDPLNSVVKSYYKNNFSFRLGGEYKINELAFRLGGSYAPSPYASPDLKSSRSTISGGLGYRKKGIFVDLTYVESIVKDVSFPYRLSEKDNAYANVTQNTGNVLLTFGIKF